MYFELLIYILSVMALLPIKNLKDKVSMWLQMLAINKTSDYVTKFLVVNYVR